MCYQQQCPRRMGRSIASQPSDTGRRERGTAPGFLLGGPDRSVQPPFTLGLRRVLGGSRMQLTTSCMLLGLALCRVLGGSHPKLFTR